jgi:ActR/RegA family two-component response regulator
LTDERSASALIVEPDAVDVFRLARSIEAAGFRCLSATGFIPARRLIYDERPEIVATNLRLGAFNGIHLAYLAKIQNAATRVMIYAREYDRLLAAEAVAAGAFYERLEFVPASIVNFLRAALPDRDRRDPAGAGRRAVFRGGRRTTDVAALHAAT